MRSLILCRHVKMALNIRVVLRLVMFCAAFTCGLLVNYYGYLFEAIRVEVRVSVEDSANSSTVHALLNAGSKGNLSAYVVPNVVHFIWFRTKAEQEMSFLNYISIVSAYRIQKPERLLFHCNFLPSGEWWNRLWKDVPLQIVHREPPATIHGQKLLHIYHRGDIAKIEILLEYGGIYLDYDVIVVNSLDPVRRFDATMGKEKPPKFIAGIILARKGSTFLRLLHESYRDNYRPFDWDYNCARIAYEIYVQRPDLLHVEPFKFTTPEWKDRHLLWYDIIDWSRLYVIHVMGHFNWEEYNPEKIKTINSTFGQVMRYIYYGAHDLILT
jgi:hypothetical protein